MMRCDHLLTREAGHLLSAEQREQEQRYQERVSNGQTGLSATGGYCLLYSPGHVVAAYN